jgi:hypothetical protein
MNKISQVAGAITILFFSLAAVTHDSSLTGRWTATLKKGDRTGTASLRLGVSGTEVTRTLSDPSGQVWEIRNGNLQGNQLTFDVTAVRRNEEHSFFRSGRGGCPHFAERIAWPTWSNNDLLTIKTGTGQANDGSDREQYRKSDSCCRLLACPNVYIVDGGGA